LQKLPSVIPYWGEPQGEAVYFHNNNTGYFTFSEKAGVVKYDFTFIKENNGEIKLK
jgi:hypothetical protein